MRTAFTDLLGIEHPIASAGMARVAQAPLVAAVSEAGGLGSFLGGRIRLFPHQLHVAERASASDPVRWLLADEVGLGKTIEAALILNRLVHTRRVERCLVVAPETLTIQWLGELWRKYHQVFTLLDAPRLADVARDFGADFNPFDVHRRAVIALEMLTALAWVVIEFNPGATVNTHASYAMLMIAMLVAVVLLDRTSPVLARAVCFANIALSFVVWVLFLPGPALPWAGINWLSLATGALAATAIVAAIRHEHDPEKWKPLFGEDHAPPKT